MEERERNTNISDGKDMKPSRSSGAPPAAEQRPPSDTGASDDGADKTDVCSDNFDPLSALYSPSVTIPVPNVKCFNNVAAYESFLQGGRGRAKPENVEKKRLKALKGAADPERIERLKKLIVSRPEDEEGEQGAGSGAPRARRKQKPRKNVLTRMALMAGPLAELYRCVEERIRVKVHIRSFKGLRGVCSGFVVAFDKFWNMALVDVDETYSDPLLGEAFYHQKTLTISRLFEKLNLQGDAESQEQPKKHKPQEGAVRNQTVNPGPSPSADESRKSSTESKKDKNPEVPVKTVESGGGQKKEEEKYGKVHTRHIKQLFIRGENVILVNPQPVGSV